ncbi:MAG: carbohydrate ABC transporter permease [Clostridia bacterium]|nr:carbohydrate ABC transporter permease [Clostridia bacterium]
MTIKKLTSRAFIYLAALLVLIFTLFPVYFCISTATKSAVDSFSIPPKWLWIPTMDNFRNVLATAGFVRSFLNSFIVAVLTTSLSLLFGIPCGYALARSKTRGAHFIGIWILLTRMLPAMGFAVPYYFLYRRVGLSDTYIGLTLIYLTTQLPFTAWLLNGFCRSVPTEIEEAARIDGCTLVQSLIRVVIPVIKPGISTAAVFAFMHSWNEYFYAKLISGSETRPVSYAVHRFVNDVGTNWGLLCAASCMVALPMIAFALIAQKSLVRGLTAGAVKG